MPETNSNTMIVEARDSQQRKQYNVSSSSVGESDVSNHRPPAASGGSDFEGGTFITGQAPRLLTWSNVNLAVVRRFVLHDMFSGEVGILLLMQSAPANS